MGSVLAVLARGGLFYEEGPRAVVPRAGYQAVIVVVVILLLRLGAFRGHGLNTDPWRAGLGLSRVGVRDLGACAHRAQLGHPDDAEG